MANKKLRGIKKVAGMSKRCGYCGYNLQINLVKSENRIYADEIIGFGRVAYDDDDIEVIAYIREPVTMSEIEDLIDMKHRGIGGMYEWGSIPVYD